MFPLKNLAHKGLTQHFSNITSASWLLKSLSSPQFIQYLVQGPGGCFTNVPRALQHILSKFVCCRNRTSYDHFKLKLCSCAQSHALGTRTKFQLEILTINVITGIVYFREIILESSQNVSETWGESTSGKSTSWFPNGFPSQKANNVESVCMSWWFHELAFWWINAKRDVTPLPPHWSYIFFLYQSIDLSIILYLIYAHIS